MTVVAPQLHLESVRKGYAYDQDKAVDPATTVANAAAKLGQMTDLGGVKLEARAGPIDGAFSYTSAGGTLNASGKGLTAEQAQASAIMELAERYSWIHFDYEHAPGYRLATHAEIVATGVETVPASYFLSNFPFLTEREPYERDLLRTRLRWVLGTRLVDGSPYYYPLNWHNMLYSSNGLASGNRFEEAVLQGLCEVIERETIFRLHMEKRLGASIDLTSLTHPLLREVLQTGENNGIRWSVVDMTSDLGVPSMVVRGTRPADEGLLTYEGVGHGCHPDPEKAIIRALSEYFEGFSWMCKVQERFGADFKGLQALLPIGNLGFHALYNPEVLRDTTGVIPVGRVPSVARSDIKEEIELIVGALEAKGYTVVVIDKSYPPLTIPVVRVFVPEMRSGLNTEFQNPAAPIAAVAKESGDHELGMHYWGEMIRVHPALKALGANRLLASLLPSVPDHLLPKPAFGADYRESMFMVHGIKKHGLGMLRQIEGLRELMGPVLQLMGGELQGGGLTALLPLLIGARGPFGGLPR
ncbi:MAG: YcaO-like family protein [Deltaproteobacteria bacterium]|nr:YcaO-like family protein [Deltaproteobacteria bacterium]